MLQMLHRQNSHPRLSVREFLMVVSELMKIRITFFVTLTTLFGYICAIGTVDYTAIFASLGIFALACSASVLNHLQEKRTDALMNRTKARPLPSNRVPASFALWLAVYLFVCGALILSLATNLMTFLLGFSALVWYNAIYTPLKKKHFIAIIPGSVIGALPPMAGWTAAGGSVLDPQILVIAFFFFIWQIPHFWLLLLLYRNDYEKAGFPTLFQFMNQSQVARMTFFWTAATGFVGMLFPVFSIIRPSLAIGLIVGAFALLLFIASSLLRQELSKTAFRSVFLGINLYVLFIVIVVSLDKLLIIL
jgi:protoheme IX farnesyltransferase